MKIFLKVLFIFILINQAAQASNKFYQYSGDMPFIEMMLNMMTTMGMIDKVPPNFMAYGNQYNNPYSPNAYKNYPEFNAANKWQGVNSDKGNRPDKTLSNQLSGVWMSRQGQMLAIKNQQFLWSDGHSRYLTGQVSAQEKVLTLKVKGNGPVMNYQYQFDNMRLQTRDSDGVVTSFVRVPMN